MKKRRLGKTGMVVSEICMGTMTFGSSCNEDEAFKILDRAYDAGIDFYDTAEIYPVPPQKSWVHRTEEIFGKWIKTKPRDGILIASKVAGPGHGWFSPPLREGKTALDKYHIRRAIEGSLQRLGVETIDLYQTHWPDHDVSYDETMEALTELKEEGKIRYAGCSNETSFGLMKSLWTSDKHNLIRYDSIQNNFSILNRRFEDELAQVCRKEGVSLLPYSPLAGGVLTGKYNGPTKPEGARFVRYMVEGERQKRMSNRFLNEQTLASTKELMEIATKYGMSSTVMSVAWSKQHDFVASTIIGANTVEQLEESLKASDLILSDEILSEINLVTKKIQYPMG
ncbi:aldo/keto reductase [Leptospira biflexa]|jgi:aryl-alcohol dehydrogenase-like predicted oxidoreductase|uniref:Protein tas n=1 Tax=Leptospira biflexa serovar Patoc (strain Patoc 1 / ATCC 23582 / Paris) TaxID=456481 RepID=B0SRA1_LEPBP|nr:aldo/keto reductase [Leptospira biflexa]ABZ95682.1 Aryl-alcohol dehydrogenase-related oxidoreductase [Leptospira biflexa serovar Patoc strain 'Patoc 1 (Ames)']ABZ99393.1 Putative reductase, NAD(P)-linked domain [Leptospira biflexa serovar Patoc strain 'Patoc 1 (Paris)']TGM46901.1 aldo/keto reductase [Leptospira biflexa]TGM50633.1 aldo/keto reductase [Leptospira biflexa]